MSGLSHTDRTTVSSDYGDLTDRLQRLSRRETAFRALRGVGLLLAALLPTLCALALLESVLYLAPTVKLAATGLLLLALAVGFGWLVAGPLLRPQSTWSIARHVEAHYGGLQQGLSNAVQLGDAPEQATSRTLAAAAVQAGVARARTLDLNAAVHPGPLLSAWRGCIISAVLCAVVAFPFGSRMRDAAHRLLSPATAYARPALTHLSIEPGHAERVSGDEISLGVRIEGLVPTVARLDIREATARDWVAHRLPVKHGVVTKTLDLRQSLDYRWSAYDATSPTYRVTVHPRPVVTHTRVDYLYPPHTRLPPRVDEDGGDIIAPTGTRVTLTAESTRPLSRGWLNLENGDPVEGSAADTRVVFDFPVTSDGRFTIGLTDTANIDNADPVSRRILAVADEPPEVAVLRPGSDGELGDAMRVLLLFEAIDDYGLDLAEVRFRLNDTKDTHTLPVVLDSAGARQLTQDATWDLSSADLLPGDHLTYHLRIYDNDVITGPKYGDSRIYTLRFPSLFEIQRDARRRHDEDLARLEAARNASYRMRQQTQELRREWLKNESPTWETRAETEEILERQEDIQRSMEESMARIEETQQRLEQSGLLSDETIQKLMEVRELMAGLDTPELRSAIRELQEATQETDSEQIDQAMARLIEQQEDFRKGLDRAIALLREVQNDQFVDALTRQIEDLAEHQRQIAEEAAATPETAPLAEPQTAVEREADAFREGLDASLDQLDESTTEALAELAERFDQHAVVPRAGQAARDLRAQRVTRARRATESLRDDLATLAERMAAIRESRLERQKADVSRELAGLLQNLLHLSRRQEQTAAAAAAKTGQRALAEKQARDLASAARLAGRMLEASHKTFIIPRSAAAGLGNALQQMEEAVSHLQRGSGSRASKSATEAMGDLNASALGIQSALQALQDASSATGFQEMLQQLQQASNQQTRLNAQTQGLFGAQKRPGGASPGDLGRMAAEQQAIQQMLDAIRKRLGTQEGRVLGDLGTVSGEMEDVAKDLERGDLTRHTLERQRRILSRLLDAQRSARQRGFSRAREARGGGVFVYRGPNALPEHLGEGVNPLRTRLRDALSEGYPDGYQPLIRRYFGRLIDEAQREKGAEK